VAGVLIVWFLQIILLGVPECRVSGDCKMRLAASYPRPITPRMRYALILGAHLWVVQPVVNTPIL